MNYRGRYASPRSGPYDSDERYRRVNVLLRRGDWELVRSAHPEGASAFIRQIIIDHCNELIAKREAKQAP